MKLYAFGEILWDVFGKTRHIGGATLNIAAHFSLHGGRSMIISAVGDDILGKDAVERVQNFGIDDTHLAILRGMPTGESIVSLSDTGIPSYKITENVAYDFIKTEGVFPDTEDVLYFGTLSLREDHNRKSLTNLITRSEFSEIFVDVNLRAPFILKESIDLALANASIIKISDEELPTLTRIALGKEYKYKTATALLSQIYPNLKIIIITRGAHGAYVFDVRSGVEHEIDAIKVKAVSTVGAGDSFSAAFLYSYKNGESIEKCLKNATRVSAFVVSVPEAVPFYDPKHL